MDKIQKYINIFYTYLIIGAFHLGDLLTDILFMYELYQVKNKYPYLFIFDVISIFLTIVGFFIKPIIGLISYKKGSSMEITLPSDNEETSYQLYKVNCYVGSLFYLFEIFVFLPFGQPINLIYSYFKRDTSPDRVQFIILMKYVEAYRLWDFIFGDIPQIIISLYYIFNESITLSVISNLLMSFVFISSTCKQFWQGRYMYARTLLDLEWYKESWRSTLIDWKWKMADDILKEALIEREIDKIEKDLEENNKETDESLNKIVEECKKGMAEYGFEFPDFSKFDKQ